MIAPGIVDAIEVPAKVSLGKKLKPAKTMSVQDAQRAIKAAGMVCLSARKIKGVKELGDYFTQIGVLSYGRGCLGAYAEHCRMGLDFATKLQTKKSDDPDYGLNLLNAIDHLLGHGIRAAESIIKSTSIDTTMGFNKPSENRSFLPGQAVFPIVTKEMHVNVGGNSPPMNEK